jgi:hypothetical protein
MSQFFGYLANSSIFDAKQVLAIDLLAALDARDAQARREGCLGACHRRASPITNRV